MTALNAAPPTQPYPVAVRINALLKGNKWRIWGEPFEIEMQSGGVTERQARRRCSHISMCLSGPSSPSGGGPQHQMESSLASSRLAAPAIGLHYTFHCLEQRFYPFGHLIEIVLLHSADLF